MADAAVAVSGHGKQTVTAQQLEDMKKELIELTTKHNMRLPVRSFMDDQTYKWRFGGPPDYTLANVFYLRGRTMNHHEGSLEQVVEDVVKTWEFERSHKLDVNEHKSTDGANFKIGANGAKMFSNVEAHEVGNYNVLLEPASESLWSKEMRTDWDGSHHAFKEAFTAFPWEVLKVFAGPPKVAFSWRHWAHFTGTYKGNEGNGQLLELTGFGTTVVSPELKLRDVEIFYNPDEFLLTLEGKRPTACQQKGHDSLGPMMPVVERKAMLAKSPQ